MLPIPAAALKLIGRISLVELTTPGTYALVRDPMWVNAVQQLFLVATLPTLLLGRSSHGSGLQHCDSDCKHRIRAAVADRLQAVDLIGKVKVPQRLSASG